MTSVEEVQALVKATEPLFTTIEMTPEVATYLMSLHEIDGDGRVKNRNKRPIVVANYARSMMQGAWRLNGESIKVDDRQYLFDGQHRLSAVIISGTTLPMLLATGLPPDAQKTVDRQAKRRLGDDLRIAGEINYDTIAAVAKRVYHWKIGERYAIKKSKQPVTDHDVLSTLEEYPEIRESTAVALMVKRQIRIPPAVGGLTHFLFNKIDPEQCEWFFQRLIEGDEMPKTHPIMVLRKAIFTHHTTAKGLLPEHYLLAYVIKAWNAYRQGREIQILRLRLNGKAAAEAFPEPV